MEENKKGIYQDLRDTMTNQFTKILETIEKGDIRKAEIEEQLKEKNEHLGMEIDAELDFLGVDTENLSEEEKYAKLEELKGKFLNEPSVFEKLRELSMEKMDIDAGKEEIDNIESELNKTVQRSVNTLIKFQDSLRKQITEKENRIAELRKENMERGDSINANEIEFLETENMVLQSQLDIITGFLAKYGTLEALREVIKTKQEREEHGYWMDEEKQEYGYFDDWIGGTREKSDKAAEETKKTEPEKAPEGAEAPKPTETEKPEPTKAPEGAKAPEWKKAPDLDNPKAPEGAKAPEWKKAPDLDKPKNKTKIKSVVFTTENNIPSYNVTIVDDKGNEITYKNEGFECLARVSKKQAKELLDRGIEGAEKFYDLGLVHTLAEVDKIYGTSAVSQYEQQLKDKYIKGSTPKLDIDYDFSELYEMPNITEQREKVDKEGDLGKIEDFIRNNDKAKLNALIKLAKKSQKIGLVTYEKRPNLFKRMMRKIKTLKLKASNAETDRTDAEPDKTRYRSKVEKFKGGYDASKKAPEKAEGHEDKDKEQAGKSTDEGVATPGKSGDEDGREF